MGIFAFLVAMFAVYSLCYLVYQICLDLQNRADGPKYQDTDEWITGIRYEARRQLEREDALRQQRDEKRFRPKMSFSHMGANISRTARSGSLRTDHNGPR